VKEDGVLIESWLALALTMISENSGNLNPVSKLVQVTGVPAAIALQVSSIGNIISCVYIIPEIAISSRNEDRQTE
jgi:hypothetical protein